MKFVIMLVILSFSFVSFADEPTDSKIKALDEKVTMLDEGLHKIEKDLSDIYTKVKNCTLDTEYEGRFMGWCPRGSFVNEVSQSNFGATNILWVTCYSYKLVCN